jgi:hypothetical protein
MTGRFMKNGQTLSYFSMLTTLATPQTIATQELRIESMFPMDGATETLHARIMNHAQNVNHWTDVAHAPVTPSQRFCRIGHSVPDSGAHPASRRI